MNLSGVKYESFVDAEGVSCVLFTSGCFHHCKGCHSPQTHDPSYGMEITSELVDKINSEINKRPFLNALVLSGGDPMYYPEECAELVEKIAAPNNNVWVYSGFTYEEIVADPKKKKLLDKCKVLVDGEFKISERDTTLSFRGSRNQRVIDLERTRVENKIILYKAAERSKK